MIDRQYSSYCFLASELSIEKKMKYSRQAAHSQSMGFAINISQGVENRNILLWFKYVLTALHVNCMILFDSPLAKTGQKCTLECYNKRS